MKNIVSTLIGIFFSTLLFSQNPNFEICLELDSNNDLLVKMRETSGNKTPTTNDEVFEIYFGIQWPETCDFSLDKNTSVQSNYDVNYEGNIQTSAGFNSQIFYSELTDNFPETWVVNQWVTIATVTTLIGNDDCLIEVIGGQHPYIFIDYSDGSGDQYTPTVTCSIEPPSCPEQSDIQQASGSTNTCNNTSGNSITLPSVTVSGNNASNVTFQWTSSTVSSIPSGQNPTVTLPQNTTCEAETHTFNLTISCTEDNNVSLDGGSVSYTVYPEPKAPTVTKDDNVCNYTVTPACPNDNFSPNNDNFSTQAPGTTGMTQNFEVSNDGCATETFTVAIPDCVEVSCGWEIESVDTECDIPTFLVCLSATEAVANLKGVDYHFAYPTSIRPTGNKEFGTDLYGDVTVMNASLNIDEEGSELYGGVSFKSSAPATATFNGTGTLICLAFEFTDDFDGNTLPTVTSDFVLESIVGSQQEDCAETGNITVDVTNQHTGYLYAQGNSINYLTDTPNDPITQIREADNNCITTTNTTLLTENGSFVVDWTTHVQLTRWNDDCQPLAPVVGAYDAFLVSLIADTDSEYIPSIFDLVAGDVDESGGTTSGDVSQLLARSVGKICEYYTQPGRVTSDWKFIDTTTLNNTDTWQLDSAYPDNEDNGADWLNVPIPPQCFDIPEGDENCGRTTMVYAAILKGDVHPSWNQAYNFKTAMAGEIIIDVENTVEVQTNTYNIPIYYQGEEQINAIDIRLDLYEQEILTVDSVIVVNESLGLVSDYNIIGDTSLLIGAFTVNPGGIPTNEPLFYIQVSSTQSVVCDDLMKGGTVHFNGAEGTLTCKTTEEPTVGINDVNPQLSLYPNPTQNQVTITYENFVNANTIIKIFDYTGKLVQQHTNLPTNKFTMNTQQMSSGIYFVVLEQGGQMIGREKLVVMK